MTIKLINFENINLFKQEKHIIRNFSLEVYPGEKINIYGKNGSGKTSLLKLIAGITQPSNGTITFDKELNVNRDIFYIGHKYGLKGELSVNDNLKYILGFTQNNKYVCIRDELKFYDMDDYLDIQIKHLSHGQKKIISLVQLALIPNKIWILDEPFTGLDKSIINKFFKKINIHIEKMGSLIITSHNPKEQFSNTELC